MSPACPSTVTSQPTTVSDSSLSRSTVSAPSNDALSSRLATTSPLSIDTDKCPSPVASPPSPNPTSSPRAPPAPQPRFPAARALLSVAQALLCPANALAAALMPPLPTLKFLPTCPQPSPDPPSFQSTPLDTPPDSLPIDDLEMPEDDVSDLRDVYDAINRLCETMRTSMYEDAETAEEAEDAPLRNIEETLTGWDAPVESNEYASDTDVAGSLLGDVMGYASDTDATSGSLLGDVVGYVSDTEVAVSCTSLQSECSARGHVAAMREKYENMSRAHTPADLTDTPR